MPTSSNTELPASVEDKPTSIADPHVESASSGFDKDDLIYTLLNLEIKVIIAGRDPKALENLIDDNMMQQWPWERRYLNIRPGSSDSAVAFADNEAAELALAKMRSQGIKAAVVEPYDLQRLLTTADDILNGHDREEQAQSALVQKELRILDRCLRALLVQQMTKCLIKAKTAADACDALNGWSSLSKGYDPILNVERPHYYDTDWALHDADLYPSGDHVEVLHRDGGFICWSDSFYVSPFQQEWLQALGAESADDLSQASKATLSSKLARLKEAQDEQHEQAEAS